VPDLGLGHGGGAAPEVFDLPWLAVLHRTSSLAHEHRGVEIPESEIVALLGPSGSGKSTLLQAVGLLEGGFQGSIRLSGEEAAEVVVVGGRHDVGVDRDASGTVHEAGDAADQDVGHPVVAQGPQDPLDVKRS